VTRVSLETDIRYALRTYYATRIAYPRMGGEETDEGITQLTGEVDGVPYGDLYREGEVMTVPNGSGQLGTIYYVVASEPGDPTITVVPEQSPGTVRPIVVLVDDIWKPEVKKGDSRVHVGIRSRPTARAGYTRALYTGRVLHEDRQHIIITAPIWRGGFWLHVDGTERREVSYVVEMLNSRAQLTSDLYKLAIDVRPRRLDLSNLENSGLFRNVIAIDVDAGLTPQTPLDQLPDGLPDNTHWPWDEIVGVSPVIEAHHNEPLPRYAEKVGDYPTSDTADESGIDFSMPETE
jgi:hypothetical protein